MIRTSAAVHFAGVLLIAACPVVLAEDSTETAGVLKLPADRRVERELAAAAEHISRDEFLLAEERLAELWFRAGSQLVETGEVVETLGDHIARQIERLPVERQQKFWERVEQQSAPDDLTTSMLNLPTRAGYLAWRAEAIRWHDQSEFELAIAAWQQASRHSAAKDHEVIEAQMRAVDLRAEIGDPGVVRTWLESLPSETRNRPLMISGTQTTLEAWLQRPRTAVVPQPTVTDRPTTTVRWSRLLITNAAMEKSWQRAADDLRESGIIRLPATTTLAIGSRIVTRTPDGLACLDSNTGAILWQTAQRSVRDRWNLAGQQANPFFNGKILSQFAQQAQTNTLACDLSHDEQTVYQVVEAGPASEPANPGTSYALEAIDLETGAIRWSAGGAKPAAGEEFRHLDWRANLASGPADSEAAEFSVCGAPCLVGGQLYLLSTQRSDLVFQCIDRETLQVAWSCRIGHLLPDLSRSSPQKYTAAIIVWTGETLACVTNCGVTLAIDPIRQQIRWVNRYPVEIRAATRLEPGGTDPVAGAILRTWREAGLWQSGGRLVTISSESQFAHVVDEYSGRTLLRIPRGNALTVLGVANQSMIILEPSAMRAVDCQTGRELWRTVTGEVRGRGVLRGEQIVQPLGDGSIAVLNLSDGRRLPGAMRSAVAWGDLTPLPDGWLSSDEFQVQRLGDVATQRAVRNEPADLTTRHQAAWLDIEAGDFAAARSSLVTLDDEPSQTLLLEADLAELHHAAAQWESIRDRWQDRPLSRDDRGELLWQLARAAAQHKRWTNVVELSLEGLALGLIGERVIHEESLRRVDWNRAFQGEIAAAFRRATVAEQQLLAELLSARWQAAKETGEPFALQQLEHRWHAIPWTRRAALDASESIFLGTGLFARDLFIKSLTQTADDGLNWHALTKQSQEWTAAGFTRDAFDVDLTRLRHSGATVNTLDAINISAMNRRHDLGPPDIWPLAVPRVTPQSAPADDAMQTPVPVEADVDSVWDRMDVSVDRQGRTLRFTGDGQQGGWTVSLPKGSTPLQQYPLTYQAWGQGRWLLVRIGTLLFAVAPWNEQGEPEARIVWSLDLLGPSAQPQEQLIVERQISGWKQAHEEFRILDPYGCDVGLVGPVRAGYLCFVRRGKLIAIETQTGRTLWEYWDLPPGSIPLGDDERIVIWSPDRNHCAVLDAADGRTLAAHPCTIPRADVWHLSGCLVWSGQRQAEVTLDCRDLASNSTVWSRAFPQHSLPLSLDDRMGAVIDPRGVLHLIDLETGTTIDEPLTVDLPQSIERFVVGRDEFRWYLGVSGPVERSFEWQSSQPLNGFRRPMLQGPLWAIDRSRRQIVWKRDVPGEPWPLDQPRSLPVLIQIFKQPPPQGGQGVGEGVLRLLDQRTGREIFTHRDLNLLAYDSFEPFPEFQKFELRMNTATFEVNYAPDDKPPPR